MTAFHSLQYAILKRFFPLREEEQTGTGAALDGFQGLIKLERLLGRDLIASLKEKVIIDFGCGEGHETIALAETGAARVIGLDIREDVLQQARRNAARTPVAHRCYFTTKTNIRADVVISIDAFEHFSDPAAILKAMDELLAPGGEVIVSFGPTWYHPRGGHLFSVFPWSHLLFSEEALIRWRAKYRSDGAQHISEVAGGLNQITIKHFEEVVRNSPFRFSGFEAVPIRKLQPLHNRLTREFLTAIVRCRLVRRAEATATAPAKADAAVSV